MAETDVVSLAGACDGRTIPDLYLIEPTERTDGLSRDGAIDRDDSQQQPKRRRVFAGQLPTRAKPAAIRYF